jgi:hypothetical protein
MVLLINKSSNSFKVSDELTIKAGSVNEVSSEIADKLLRMYPQSFEVKIIGQSDKIESPIIEEKKVEEVKRRGRKPKIEAEK